MNKIHSKRTRLIRFSGKFTLFLFMLCIIAFTGEATLAHPPKSVNLTLQGNSLNVNIAHSVNDPGKHYIYKVVVYVNDNVVTQKEYKSQQTPAGLTDTFNIGKLPAGTSVKAEAFCVIMGSTIGSLTAN